MTDTTTTDNTTQVANTETQTTETKTETQIQAKPANESVVTGDTTKVDTTTTKVDETKTTETKAEETKTDATKDTALEYRQYNDPAADSITFLLKEAKVLPADAAKIFEKATQSGNLADIDMKALEEKVGKERANLIKISAEAYFNNQVQAFKAHSDAVYTAVGGQDAWKQMLEWAHSKEKADPAFATKLVDYRKMIDASPEQAKLAGEALLNAYKADPKTNSLKVRMTEADKAGSTGSDLKYITRVDYFNAVKAANKKGDSVEVGNLNARRMASVAQEKERNKSN